MVPSPAHVMTYGMSRDTLDRCMNGETLHDSCCCCSKSRRGVRRLNTRLRQEKTFNLIDRQGIFRAEGMPFDLFYAPNTRVLKLLQSKSTKCE